MNLLGGSEAAVKPFPFAVYVAHTSTAATADRRSKVACSRENTNPNKHAPCRQHFKQQRT